jgi:hypothetical protein
MPKIQSRGRPSILQEDCIQKNVSVWGINISLRVIDLRKKKGSYSAVFISSYGKNIMLNIQSWGRPSILQEDCTQKNISVSSINILLWIIDLRKTILPFLRQSREKYYA